MIMISKLRCSHINRHHLHHHHHHHHQDSNKYEWQWHRLMMINLVLSSSSPYKFRQYWCSIWLGVKQCAIVLISFQITFLTRPLRMHVEPRWNYTCFIIQQDAGHQKTEDHHAWWGVPHCHTEGQEMMTSLCGERKNSCRIWHVIIFTRIYWSSELLLCYILIWCGVIFTGRYWCAELWPDQHIGVLYLLFFLLLYIDVLNYGQIRTLMCCVYLSVILVVITIQTANTNPNNREMI